MTLTIGEPAVEGEGLASEENHCTEGLTRRDAEQGSGPREAGGCQAVIFVESLESGLDVHERAFTAGGMSGARA